MSSCDLGNLISEHFNMLIDIFKDDLQELGVEDVYTKCLYTAVTILYLFCGELAKEGSLKCYVDNVKEYMKDVDDKSHYAKTQIEKAKELIKKKDRKRLVFFIMLTNNDLPHPTNANKEDAFFPGHVFVIDKQFSRDSDIPFYRLYQSYINQYTLQDFSKTLNLKNNNVKKKSSSSFGTKHMEYDFTRMSNFLEDLDYFVNSKFWDEKNIRFWQEFTLTNAKGFKGYPILGYIHFCFNALPALRCKKGLLQLLEEKKRKGEIAEKYIETVNKLLRQKNNNSNSNNSNCQNGKCQR